MYFHCSGQDAAVERGEQPADVVGQAHQLAGPRADGTADGNESAIRAGALASVVSVADEIVRWSHAANVDQLCFSFVIATRMQSASCDTASASAAAAAGGAEPAGPTQPAALELYGLRKTKAVIMVDGTFLKEWRNS